jgi:hypothetical protein
MAGPAKFLIALLVLAAGAAVALQTGSQKPRRPAPAPAGPPADAEYVSEGPQEIIVLCGARRRPGQPDPADEFIGKWAGPQGWDGECRVISTDKGRPMLHLYTVSSTMIGGGYWILAVVGEDHGVKLNDTVRVQGRIAGVATRAAAAEVVSTVRLEDARVVR